MSKILLLGPAGSGKTHRLLDEFEQTLRLSKDPLEEDCFFVLPSAEHTERMISLIVQRGISGFFYRRVTTLSRLIPEVFGIGEENVASNVTRFLILREMFQKHSWNYFQEVQQSSGFLNLMLSFLDELKESLISSSLFRGRMNALKKIDPDFAVKYETLAEIYENYESELAKQGVRHRQDALLIYREMKKKGELRPLRFKKIWLDGFFDFSNLQLEYIRELAELSDDITIALTKDKNPLRQDLFEGVNRTEEFLVRLDFEPRWISGPNFRAKNQTLTYLEKHLFVSSRPKKKALPGDELIIFEAIGMEGEIEMIAREIERIYRSGNYRFSDFAILLRQIGSYAEIIRSVFSRYEIPVEIHEREKLQFSPVIQVVVRLFKIFREGWRRSDLIAFLKSSYVRRLGGMEKNWEWISELENWALRQGILQGRENWLSRAQPSEAFFGQGFWRRKEEILSALQEFEEALRGASCLLELKRIILGGLSKKFGIFEIQDSLAESVRRDAASYRRLEALLDEIGTSLGPPADRQIDFDSFVDRFLHLAELDLYSLHHRDKNRLQVYDVSLARQKEYRIVFVAGLLEKGFPIQIKEDPILSDWERELFNTGSSETPLRERLPRQTIERYLFYLAVTRAGEKLFLTYPRLDLEGEESLPSNYVEEARSLFAQPLRLKTQDLAHPYPEIHEAQDWRELEISLMGELWNFPSEKTEEALLLYLTNALLRREESRTRIRRAFYEVRAELTDPAIREGDYFQSAKTSPTKLEEYARCPFFYFAHRILQLKDPEEEVNVKLKGIILHEVLENFFREWLEHSQAWADSEKVRQFISKELEKALSKNPLIFEKRYQGELELDQMHESLRRFLAAELMRLETSPLQPRYLELSFGLKPRVKNSFPAFQVKAGNRNISLSGRMDRLDVDSKHRLGVVIDYKSSAQFKRKALELGYALQLPIYLKVMEENLKLKPVGGEIYSIRDCKKQGFYHREHAASVNYISSRQLSLSEKEFEGVVEQSIKFVRRFTEQMANGNIAVRPRDADYCRSLCPYSAVCRIEKWRLPLILEEIKGEDRRDENPKS